MPKIWCRRRLNLPKLWVVHLGTFMTDALHQVLKNLFVWIYVRNMWSKIHTYVQKLINTTHFTIKMLFVVAWWQKKDTTKQPRWFPTFFQINRIFGAKKKCNNKNIPKNHIIKCRRAAVFNFIWTMLLGTSSKCKLHKNCNIIKPKNT